MPGECSGFSGSNGKQDVVPVYHQCGNRDKEEKRGVALMGGPRFLSRASEGRNARHSRLGPQFPSVLGTRGPGIGHAQHPPPAVSALLWEGPPSLAAALSGVSPQHLPYSHICPSALPWKGHLGSSGPTGPSL